MVAVQAVAGFHMADDRFDGGPAPEPFSQAPAQFFLAGSHQVHLGGFPSIISAIAHVAEGRFGCPAGQAPHLFKCSLSRSWSGTIGKAFSGSICQASQPSDTIAVPVGPVLLEWVLIR